MESIRDIAIGRNNEMEIERQSIFNSNPSILSRMIAF